MIWLGALSMFVLVLEQLFPARQQKLFRKGLWSDALHLIFNGHFFGLLFYGLAAEWLLPSLDACLLELGVGDLSSVQLSVVSSWSLVAQAASVLLLLDFLHWCIHNLLHRVPVLWRIHQIHHSVEDGEMSWIVAFRFSWLESVIYKSLCYLPLAVLGFSGEAIFVHAVCGTLIGHLNHANLNWDYGVLRYVLNSPRMHLHHHDYHSLAPGQNFGIIFSCWDWIFGTAKLPEEPPTRIGVPTNQPLPRDFIAQAGWPLTLFLGDANSLLARAVGVFVVGVLFALG